MIYKRILSAVLCIIILSCLVLSSCSAETADSGDTTANPVKESGETEPPDELSDNLPDLNFDGAAFRIFCVNTRPIQLQEIYAEQITAEIVNDAVYRRNSEIEERFGIKFDINSMGYAAVNTAIRTNVSAATDFADLVVGQSVQLVRLVTDKLFVDWFTVDHIDFEKPWWNKKSLENLVLGDHGYFVMGDLNLSALYATYCMYFNKPLLEDMGFSTSSVYEMVMNGEWTVDKLKEISSGLYRDLNGNTGQDTEDQVGIILNTTAASIACLYSSGMKFLSMDSEGYPYHDFNQERLANIVDKYFDLYYNNGNASLVNTKQGDDETLTWFSAGRAGFMQNLIGNASLMREVGFDYGIIPYPKFDAGQENYGTMSNGFMTLQCIPVTAPDLEMTGVITEALNAYSYKIVTPAFYETALKVKYAKDSESGIILDDIVRNTVIDGSYIYLYSSGFSYTLQTLLPTKNNTFSSFYASRAPLAESELKRITDAHKKAGG